MFLVSLLTNWWRTDCCLLGQSQNSIQFWESLEKNSLSSMEIAAELIWYRWVKELRIFLVIWRELVMTTICLTLGSATAWLMPHQIAKSLASAMVILIVLCKVLMTGLLKEWMCKMEVVTWFLMLASDTTIVKEGLENVLNVTLSKFFICFLTFIRWGWKENWSGKISTIRFPGLNPLLKKQKEEKILLCFLSISIRSDFNWILCLAMRQSMDALWHSCSCDPSELRILWIIWLDGREDCYNKNLSYSFLRWR